MSNYFKHLQELKLGKLPAAGKTPEPIAKQSDKMKAELKKYIREANIFLAKPENQNCKIKFKGCTKKADCIHHTAGRIGVKLHDQDDWMPSCINCNLSVEVNDKEAREKGFKKTRMNA